MEIKIAKILSKSKGKRFVFVSLSTPSYGEVHKGEFPTVNEAFHRKDWKRIKNNMSYTDQDRVDIELAHQLDILSEDDYIEFCKQQWIKEVNINDLDLTKIDDELLVKEVNRRLENDRSSEIVVECSAVLKMKEYEDYC